MKRDFETKDLQQDDARFREGVRKGIEQVDRGEFVEEAEMAARVKQMLTVKPSSSSAKAPRVAQSKRRS